MPLPDRRLRLPDPTVRVDGQRAPATTRLGYAGPYQLTLSTALPELGAELHSAYLGHPDGEAAVAHLALAPDTQPAVTTRLAPGGELPVGAARRRCLYDHLAELGELLGEITAGHVAIELADHATALVDVA